MKNATGGGRNSPPSSKFQSLHNRFINESLERIPEDPKRSREYCESIPPSPPPPSPPCGVSWMSDAVEATEEAKIKSKSKIKNKPKRAKNKRQTNEKRDATRVNNRKRLTITDAGDANGASRERDPAAFFFLFFYTFILPLFHNFVLRFRFLKYFICNCSWNRIAAREPRALAAAALNNSGTAR